MAGNPVVNQGALNRARPSLIVPAFPNLNIIQSSMGKMGIRIAFEGSAVPMIDTMTGMVTSPEPYLPAVVTVQILRTMNLAALWRSQMENQSGVVGQVNVVTDSSVWVDYTFLNMAMQQPHEIPMDGTDPHFYVVLRGTYPINAALFNLQ